jgi:hypothetical protein
MDVIVVGEFGHRDIVGPVILSVVAKNAQVLFEFLVDTFCLSVRLGVERRRIGSVDFEFLEQSAHQFGSELSTSVRYHFSG